MKMWRFSIVGAIAMMFVASTLAPGATFGVESETEEESSELTRLYLPTPAVELGEVPAGYTYSGIFKLNERTDVPAQVKVYTAPFSMKEEDYTPVYEGVESYRNTIKDWISFPDGTDYTVPANSEIEIPYVITVPGNALGGSQYCAIIIENVKPESQPSGEVISTTAVGRVALPIYADILGDEAVASADFLDWSANSFYFSPPIRASFEVENTGNIMFSVEYVFEVIDAIRGGDSVYTDEGSKKVFPDTKRMINHEWANTPYLGLFKVNETISYLDETQDFSRIVLVVPLWLVIIVILMIVLAVVAIIKRVKTAKTKGRKDAKATEQQ